ncbi:MAG: efflux RND transporter periplasmic adaptor subunit [Verrucomicrobiales bacterium]|nr:efflux RND transporter periplasmic adaptor subunit [Verrucomicrobiales bacterium]
MTRPYARALPFLPILFLLGMVLAGCGDRKEHSHGHDHGPGEEHGHHHGHEGTSPSGASFKAGQGVTLTQETKQLLGVEVVEVTPQTIHHQIRFTLQVFSEQHRHVSNPDDHSGCDVHGSGLLPSDALPLAKPGQAVEVIKQTNSILNGVVLSVHNALVLGEPEIIVGVSNATQTLKHGEFVPARILIPQSQAQAAIPQSAVLHAAEGSFVYVVNGDAYLRTAVKVGAEDNDMVEITDGLLEGDQVVSRPVQTLWLIELRATKGGGHSH